MRGGVRRSGGRDGVEELGFVPPSPAAAEEDVEPKWTIYRNSLLVNAPVKEAKLQRHPSRFTLGDGKILAESEDAGTFFIAVRKKNMSW